MRRRAARGGADDGTPGGPVRGQPGGPARGGPPGHPSGPHGGTPRGGARAGALAVTAAAAMVTAYFLLPLDDLGAERHVLSWGLFTGTLALIALLLLAQTRSVLQERATGRSGLIVLVLVCLSLLVFAAAYYVLGKDPGQFSGLRTRRDALYFAVATLATVGDGNLAPRGQEARLVCLLQIVYNLVVLTAAVTTVAQHVRRRVAARASPPGVQGR